ncbi:MAG TPA: hypothetical protein VGG90_05065 [Candidatus Dormibacteraeota bacterium]
MNDFDRLLHIELRQMLDPVVAIPAPPRNRRRRTKGIALRAFASPLELVAGTLPVVEPAVVAVPVASASLLS